MRRMTGKFLRGLGYLLILVCAFAALLSLPRAGFLPQYIGQAVIALLGGPVLVILIAGLCLALWRWQRTSAQLALATSIIAGIGAAACMFTIGGYVQAARQNGFSVDYARLSLPGPFRYDGPSFRRFTYDHFDGKAVDLIVYKPVRPTKARKAPVLIYVHGGGWTGGDADPRNGNLQWFARQGYVVIGVNYSLSSSRKHRWDIVQPQVACALSWIARNAERFAADPERMALMGESAGGNIILNVGGMSHRGAIASRCGGVVPKIAAMIAISPPVDLVGLYHYRDSRHFAVAYTGGTPVQYPSRYAAVSPIKQVAEPAPPTLLMTGLDDSVVPVRDMLDYANRAEAAGNSMELITVPRAGHGFEIIPGTVGHQIVRQATMRFLKRNGLAP